MSKYEAWREAKQAQQTARREYSDSSGGSTEKRYTETLNNLKQADLAEADTWQQLTEDPEG